MLSYKVSLHSILSGRFALFLSAKSGDRFEGEWQFGKSHGMGKMFYGPDAPEASFNGSWSNGVRSGLGILTFKNGDRFEGHWRDSQKEGSGRYFYKATNQVIATTVCHRRGGSSEEGFSTSLLNVVAF